MSFDIGLDLFPLTAAVLAAATCGLLGNFLVLRRLSLMGDAISHSVLPGLVAAFIVAGTRNPLAMLAGAAAAGVATVVLIELVKRLGRVEPGAAMGVVFSVLFALGVLLIEGAGAKAVDIDADCVLHGQLETLISYQLPDTFAGLLTPDTLGLIPRQIWLLFGAFAASLLLVVALFKELRIAAFDPELATTQGVSARAMHYVLMVFVAVATVASFEAVGSILVVAMLIVPAVVARLLTDRLAPQIAVSLAVATACGVLGYFGATIVPAAIGLPEVNAAGSMTLVAGGLFVVAALFSPRHGALARVVRRRRLARRSATDDLLARLLRRSEAGESIVPAASVEASPGLPSPARAVAWASRKNLIESGPGGLSLTEAGTARAADVLRRHRRWETYLVGDADLRPDHVHDTAEQLEHLPVTPPVTAPIDPHGRPIP